MADTVPTTGRWQTDPTLTQLMSAYLSAKTAANTGRYVRGAADAEAAALKRYIETNRSRLDIPKNYFPDPRSKGQLLYDPNQNVWRDIAITGAAMAAGGWALGTALAPAAASAAAPAAEIGVSTSAATVPAGITTASGLTGSTAAELGAAGASHATAAHWLAPVLQQAVPVAGNLISAHMQANANRDATAAEIAQLDKALEYQKEQDAYARADAEERKRYSREQFTSYSAGLEPYRTAGVAATGRTEGALATSRYQPQTGVSAPAPATVQMRAPDGSLGNVPMALVTQAEAKGAVRVS